jgi:hypothetical protein
MDYILLNESGGIHRGVFFRIVVKATYRLKIKSDPDLLLRDRCPFLKKLKNLN